MGQSIPLILATYPNASSPRALWRQQRYNLPILRERLLLSFYPDDSRKAIRDLFVHLLVYAGHHQRRMITKPSSCRTPSTVVWLQNPPLSNFDRQDLFVFWRMQYTIMITKPSSIPLRSSIHAPFPSVGTFAFEKDAKPISHETQKGEWIMKGKWVKTRGKSWQENEWRQ